MPDPDRLTVSATEAPGLFGVSPYVTRWMLWQRFAKGIAMESDEHSRMVWGRKMQPLIIDHAAQELRLEVQSNEADVYHRRGLLGCTRDATIICPDRGPGALETKCVFDYATWMSDWAGGKSPPRQHEIQLQQQMFVGDECGSYQWGIIAAWVAGDVYYFEREPILDLWDILQKEAAAFLAEVKEGREPDPFGVPIELPWLTQLFPTVAGKVIDLTEGEEADKLALDAALYADAKTQETFYGATAEKLRAKFMGLAKDAQQIDLPDGIRVRIQKSGKGKTVKVFVPEGQQSKRAPSDLLMAG